jgi:hypothetical protein
MRAPLSFRSKLALFAITGVALQTGLYNAFGPWGDFDELASFERYRPAPADVLALADSTFLHVGEADADRRRLPEMLQALLPAGHVELVVHPGYHGRVFKEFLAYAASAHRLPPRVLIDVNLASFGENWDGVAQYEFVYERRSLQLHHSSLLAPWVPFLSIFRAVDLLEKSDRPSLVTLERAGAATPAPRPFARTLPTTAFAPQFRGSYLRALTSDHPKLVALRETAALLSAAGSRAVFYVTPVDWESGVEAVGEEFRPGIARNVAVIKGELAKAGCALHDFSELLPARDFIWHTDEHRPGEHLAEAGRQKLAHELAGILATP